MPKLLTRDDFRNSVFKRDNMLCVICAELGKDAHHILERRLFEDGGYYIDNGATLCEKCHIKAEQTLISPMEIRAKIGVTKPILPEHLYDEFEYTKWGDIQNTNGSRIKGELFYDESVQKILESGNVLNLYSKYIKHPRVFHLPFSFGRTTDDKAIKDCSQFEGKNVIVSVKLDGEQTTGHYNGHIHARSIDSDNHPSRTWVKNFLSEKLYELPYGYRICGENVYAKHSIFYKNLESYFFMFSIWNDKNHCLGWDETVEWAKLLDINTVSVLYDGMWDEEHIKSLYNEKYEENDMEGYVVRLKDSFPYHNFKKSVAKFVRKSHVQMNQHWLRTQLTPNSLK